MKQINVTKTFLPPKEEFDAFTDQIWKSGMLTNQGPLLAELEASLKTHLKLSDFHFMTNGTIALQISLKALGITEGEVITTPFSYVATTSSILWERCQPVFVDIEPGTLCIDPNKIEAAITGRTKAIMPVHVFGHPCDVEAIEAIAKKHGLKVIYDAAHAFGVEYEGKSLLDRGDISVCSFHATKLFHTIEGGCIVAKDKAVSDEVELIKRFGHNGDDHYRLGINAKASEFNAAMGLCNLKYIDEIIAKRKRLSDRYDTLLKGRFERPILRKGTRYNYSYYPVLAKSEKELLEIIKRLNKQKIFPRRYFYPALNTLPYLDDTQKCPIAEDVANRVMCLPLYADLEEEDINRICEVINQ